jgi:hypothetical protein
MRASQGWHGCRRHARHACAPLQHAHTPK